MAQSNLSTKLSETENFYREFHKNVKDIDELLDSYAGQPGSQLKEERNADMRTCASRIHTLRESVQFTELTLPARDQRSYTDALKRLDDKLTQRTAASAPKPKFGFSRKLKPPAAASPGELSESKILEPNQTLGTNTSDRPSIPAAEDSSKITSAGRSITTPTHRFPASCNTDRIELTDHFDMHIYLPPSAYRENCQGVVSHIDMCITDLSSRTRSSRVAFAGITVTDVKKSILILGDVRGAAHITDVQNSIIVVSCQQFRLHNSLNVEIYLSCASRPIIENSMDIHFAPLPEVYRSEGPPAASIDWWDDVQDFQWLRQTPSPNWDVVPEIKRQPPDLWDKVVSDGKHRSRDILKIAGIRELPPMTVEEAGF